MFNGNTSSQHDHITNGSRWDLYFTTCEPYRKNIDSKGFWFRDNPTRHVFPIILIQIILMFFFSRLIYYILRPLKQPKFICNILAGITLGPSVLSQDKGFHDRIFQPREMLYTNLISVVGVIYFIFLAAVKMDKSRILTTARNSMNMGLTGFIFPLVIVLFLFHLFPNFIPGNGGIDFRLNFSACTSLSYFPVISNALSELNLLTSELGEIAMSCAIVHEVVGWVLLLLSEILEENPSQIAQCVIVVFMLILFITLVLRPVVLWVIRQTPEGKPVDGHYVKAILAGTLIMGLVTDMIGTTIIPGTLMMGLIIPSGPPLGTALVERCEVVISELILPFLYIRAGQLMNVYSIKDWKVFSATQFIMLVSYLGKIAGCFLALPWSNTGFRNSFLLGLILNTRGVIELNILLRWRAEEFIDEPTFASLVIFNVFVTGIVTPLLKIFYKPQARFQSSSSAENCARTLQGTPLTGEFRIMCCMHSEDNVHGIISLLRACNSKAITQMRIYAIHLSDLVGQAEPLFHPYTSQRKQLKVSSPTDRIMRALKKSMVKGSSTIHPFRVIAPYNTVHENICKLAQNNLIPLVLVPFPENLEAQGKKATLRSFNINMQAYGSCTVGILVDRSLPGVFGASNFNYKVGVIFIGGPDDREALALISRMSGNPGVRITVLRIDLKEERDMYESETYLDDCLIGEFKAMNEGNDRVAFREVVAESTTQVVDSIRDLVNNYDLMIVGERRRRSSRLEQELSPWVENKELGVIGDLVASSDFSGGMVSVLVMHCVVRDYGDVIGSSMTNSDERSRFSISSLDGDTDHKVEKNIVR